MAIPTEKPSYGPLDGVKVVYAAVELACPKAADLMADWGRMSPGLRTPAPATLFAIRPISSRPSAATSVPWR